LTVDNPLLETAFHVGGLKTPRETVNAALAEFIKKRKTEDLTGLFHSVEYDSGYDYKKSRNRK
jgi:Arc/MetJ family transcription regulator